MSIESLQPYDIFLHIIYRYIYGFRLYIKSEKTIFTISECDPLHISWVKVCIAFLFSWNYSLSDTMNISQGNIHVKRNIYMNVIFKGFVNVLMYYCMKFTLLYLSKVVTFIVCLHHEL